MFLTQQPRNNVKILAQFFNLLILLKGEKTDLKTGQRESVASLMSLELHSVQIWPYFSTKLLGI